MWLLFNYCRILNLKIDCKYKYIKISFTNNTMAEKIKYSVVTKSHVNDIFVYYTDKGNYRLIGKMNRNSLDCIPKDSDKLFYFEFPKYDTYVLELLGKDPYLKSKLTNVKYMSNLETNEILNKGKVVGDDLLIDLLFEEKTNSIHALIIETTKLVKKYDITILPITRLTKVSKQEYQDIHNKPYPFDDCDYFCNIFQIKLLNYKKYDIEYFDKLFSDNMLKINIYKTYSFEELVLNPNNIN